MARFGAARTSPTYLISTLLTRKRVMFQVSKPTSPLTLTDLSFWEVSLQLASCRAQFRVGNSYVVSNWFSSDGGVPDRKPEPIQAEAENKHGRDSSHLNIIRASCCLTLLVDVVVPLLWLALSFFDSGSRQHHPH